MLAVVAFAVEKSVLCLKYTPRKEIMRRLHAIDVIATIKLQVH